jgi:hypothetical protein
MRWGAHADAGNGQQDRDGTGARDAHRIQRLLACYPRSWRARYGDEFAALLLADFAERPRNWRRTADVALSGLLARLSWAGLTSHDLEPADQIRAGLATTGCALAVFMGFGTAMLAQLATGLQWASTPAASTRASALIMLIAAGLLVLLGLAGVVPIAWQTAVSVISGKNRQLAGPVVLVLASAAVLVAGARHFQNGWPGTGGTGLQHGLIPAGLAAFGWASTLAVSSYWAHPALLGGFPGLELAWMVVSPLAWAGVVAGGTIVVRRLTLPRHLLRYQAGLAATASVAAVGLLAGAGRWVLSRGQLPGGLFHPGLVDVVGLTLMVVALIVALRAAVGLRQARLALRRAGEA